MFLQNGKTLLMAAVITEKLELVKMCLEVLDAQDDVVNIQEKVKLLLLYSYI